MILNKLEHFVVNKLKKVGFDKNKRGIIRVGRKTLPHSNLLWIDCHSYSPIVLSALVKIEKYILNSTCFSIYI